ncbi:hypothetical protein ACI3PL_22305, partial [Lacticaseibacillus paracasei]
MANVNTNNIPVPRTARNKRIYAGNTSISSVVSGGGTGGGTVLNWVSVSDDQVLIDRDLVIQGDTTFEVLSGLS